MSKCGCKKLKRTKDNHKVVCKPKCNKCPKECTCGCNEFIYVNNTSTPLTVTPGNSLSFNNPPSPLIGDGIQFNAGSSYLTITEAGVYSYNYYIIYNNVITTALFLNGKELPGSRYGNIAGHVILTGQGIFIVKCKDVPGVLQLQAVSQIIIPAGIVPPPVNASLFVNRIN